MSTFIIVSRLRGDHPAALFLYSSAHLLISISIIAMLSLHFLDPLVMQVTSVGDTFIRRHFWRLLSSYPLYGTIPTS